MTVTVHDADNNNATAALIHWADTIAGAQILPPAYRRQPANIVVAAMLGANMGLSWIESLYRIHVIQGTPAASAELIATNVRKSGHRLRVETSANPLGARATITRKDDPEFEFSAVWTMDRAQRAGLTGKDNWKHDPVAMLRSRAVTEVARMACPEALYGVTYDAGEIGGPEPMGAPEDGAHERIRASEPVTPATDWANEPGTLSPDDFAAPSPAVTVTIPEPVKAAPEPDPEPDPADLENDWEPGPQPEPGVPDPTITERPITDSQRRMMFRLFNRLAEFAEHPAHSEKGRAARLLFVNDVLGRTHDDYLTTTNELTVREAARVIDRLEALAARADAGELPLGDDTA